jgi:enediyne core biosynthesis thioesterase
MHADNQKRWLEYRHKITFIETNVVGNVYFSHYFALMGKTRDAALEQLLPNVESYLKQGFGLITEYAHIDFAHEGRLYDALLIRMGCLALSRTRIEFEFEFIREQDTTVLCTGRTAIIWVNPQHRPAIMPDSLYDGTVKYYGLANHD